MSPTTDSILGVTSIALQALPSILALFQKKHAEAYPDAPPLTSEQVLAGLAYLVAAGVAKDDAWRAAHPETNPKPKQILRGEGTGE